MILDELAVLAEEPLSALGRWHQLGLLHLECDSTGAKEFARVRLVRFALNRGCTGEEAR